MNLDSPDEVAQLNGPLEPPVPRMYRLPALTKACTLVASRAGEMPAKLSESQLLVAKAQTSVEFGMALVTGCTVPVTADLWAPVLKSALIVTSLYAAKMKPGGVPPPPPFAVVTLTATLSPPTPAESTPPTVKL